MKKRIRPKYFLKLKYSFWIERLKFLLKSY
jgi:hypothetical protein